LRPPSGSPGEGEPGKGYLELGSECVVAVAS
jgi:hypothetical protein